MEKEKEKKGKKTLAALRRELYDRGSSKGRLVNPKEQKFVERQRKEIEGLEFVLAGVVLCRSFGLDGKIICAVTNSKFSHSGVLLEDQHGQRWLFECTGSEEQVRKGINPQVQISSLDQVLKKYDGDVAVRILSFEKGAPVVTHYVEAWLGIPYEKRPLELIASIAEWNHKENDESLFCSEMVALLLQKAGCLGSDPENDRLANNFTPKDFSPRGGIDLLDGVKMHSLTYLKKQTKSHQRCLIA